MKNFCLLILSLFIAGISFAQAPTCADTNATYLLRSAGGDIYNYQDEYGGYILGSDSINEAVGDNFDVGRGNLTGVLIWFGSKTVNPDSTQDSLNVYVYNTNPSDSLPTGYALDSAKIAFTDVDTAFDNDPINFTYVAFPHTPLVTTNYAIVVQTYYGLSVNIGDSISILGNSQGDGNGERRAIMDNFGTWLHCAQVWQYPSGAFDADALMMPIVNQSFFAAAAATQTAACPGGVINLNVNAFSCPGIASYLWSGPGINNPYDQTTTATIPDNQVDSAQYIVEVIDSNTPTPDVLYDTVTVPIKNISINAGDDTTIPCGQTITLSATISGNAGLGTVIQWQNGPSSLNYPNVGAGTYTVNVTNATGCTASSTVTIGLSDGEVAGFAVHTESFQYRDTITTSPCTNGVDTFVNTSSTLAGWTWTWSYTNGGVGNEPNLITQGGTFPLGLDTITLTGDSGACSVTYTSTITPLPGSNYRCLLFNGINGTMDLADMINVFPNPTTGLFNVSFKGVESDNVNIGVYDILGRNLFSENNFAVNGDETKTLDLSRNANGIYFVRVQVDGQPYTMRVSVDK